MRYQQIMLSKSAVFSAIAIVLTLLALVVGMKNISVLYDSFRLSAVIAALVAGFTYKMYYKHPGKALILLTAIACLCSNMESFF